MVKPCNMCGEVIDDDATFCPKCGATFTNNYSGSSAGNYVSQSSKGVNKKLLALVVSVVVIIAVVLGFLFLGSGSADKNNFVGSWTLSYDMSGMSSSDQIWTFYENGTLRMLSNYEDESSSSSPPNVAFVKDDVDDTLTVAYVDSNNDWGWGPTIQDVNWEVKGNELCMDMMGMNYCLDYEFIDDNTIEISSPMMSNIKLKLIKTETPDYSTIMDDNDNDNSDDDLKWEDLKITGECDTSYLTGYVNAGEMITNCSGTINIAHKPTNTLLGTWTFT